MAKNMTPNQKATQTTIRRYGKNFFSEIGSIGGQTTVNRYGTQLLSLVGTLGNPISQRREKRVRAAIATIVNTSNK